MKTLSVWTVSSAVVITTTLLFGIGMDFASAQQRVDSRDANQIYGGQFGVCGSNIVTTGVTCTGTVYNETKQMFESCTETIPEWKFGNQKGKWYELNSMPCTTPCGSNCGFYTPNGKTGKDCSSGG